MSDSILSNTLSADTLEIHYWFGDESHSMNANVQNRCEYEVLAIIKEIATLLSVEITIETEPDGEGGLRKWLKVISKEENKKGTITTAIIVALISVILITPLSKISEKLIDKIFEDTEMNDLQKEKLRLEIEKLKKENASKVDTIDYNTLIKKRKSNFYEALDKYPKVDKVSFVVVDENKTRVTKEKAVPRDDFSKFILVTDDLDPLEKEDAVIEIIAPVLKKGNYKWIGYYKGEAVPFNMKSNEFKTLVQNGEIEFKNGSSINCHLEIRRKVNNEGLEINVGYDVLRVNYYFENDKPIETKEGKHHRQIKEAQKNQLKLFKEKTDEEN
ncbi:hypothetical protein ACFOWM_13790 [Ferruginibacter yonginensis]|uniref:Uncharacterized protein n=1 Tax=Ferruginibacter yonginensis TaxID=1310416 RepID=A0ABV8QUK5_9BACT